MANISGYRSAIVAATIGITACGYAQENIFRPLPGAKEIGISGNVTSAGGVTTYGVLLDGGLYLTDRLVALARIGVAKHSPPVQEYFLGARYDFKQGGGTIPYALAGVEFHSGDRGSTQAFASRIVDPNAGPKATVFEGGLGMDFFLQSHASLFAEIVAFKASGGSDVGTNLRVGVRFFFK